MTASVFLSYSSQNWRQARDLRLVLVARGWNVWLDQEAIAWRQRAVPRLLDGVERADVLVVLWDARSAASAWVRGEWRVAIQLQRPVLVVRLDDTPVRIPPLRARVVDARGLDVGGLAGLIDPLARSLAPRAPRAGGLGRWPRAASTAQRGRDSDSRGGIFVKPDSF